MPIINKFEKDQLIIDIVCNEFHFFFNIKLYYIFLSMDWKIIITLV